MRVVHINATVQVGGAAVAMTRLHRALLDLGVDSRMLVGEKHGDDQRVQTTPSRKPHELAWGWLSRQLGYNDEGARYTFGLARHPLIAESDVIHLHNLHGNYFLYRALPGVLAGKAAVWTLHDMWPLTGHCAHSFDCQRWRTGCGRCPYPNTYPLVKRDTTAQVWRRRKRAYESVEQRSELAVVSPSRWLAKLASEGLLGGFPIDMIPHGLDLVVYKPRDKAEAHAATGLPQDKLVLLCAAAKLSSEYKGMDLLAEALRTLPETWRSRVVLAAMGEDSAALADKMPIPVQALGFIANDAKKAMIYAAADLFVLPSRADNAPLVVQESIACGTPVVAFNVGGVSDMVREGVTGLLASTGDAGDLRSQIIQLLAQEPRRIEMGRQCRRIAEAEYDIRDVARRYVAVYERQVQAMQTP